MTPAIKLLEQLTVPHLIHSYAHDSRAESYGLEASEALNIPAQRVFKTLIIETQKRELCVGIVPVSSSLNMKAIATAVDDKKAAMADKNRAQNSSGYILGGMSPIAQKKRLKTVLDSSAFQFETIFVSAGRRGMDIELAPSSLIEICDAITASIAA